MVGSFECIQNEDLVINDTIVNGHDFNYIHNPEFEICGKNVENNITLLVYGKSHFFLQNKLNSLKSQRKLLFQPLILLC